MLAILPIVKLLHGNKMLKRLNIIFKLPHGNISFLKGSYNLAFYNCLLFDADDTLLDFDLAEQSAFSNTMQNFFPQIEVPLETYREINNKLWKELELGKIKQAELLLQRFIRLMQAIGQKGDATAINEYYLSQLEINGQAIDGAKEALEELSEVATIAVVSNGIERVQLSRLEKSGLLPYIDEVFISSRVGAAKPSRKIFDTALSTLGITNKQKVLVIGDSLSSDIQGGISAQLDTCWWNPNNEPSPTGHIQPTHTVRGFEELLRVVMDEEELQNVGSSEKRHKL